MPRRHRTTARSIIALLALWVSAGTANAAVPRLDFPVVAVASYQNDFGDPRSGHTHQGNDVMGRRWSPLVAVEAGTVSKWTSSSTAGCMLYLYGKSGTTYMYVHLNNDRTTGNDSSGNGNCVNGIAYAPGLANGQTVRAGQLVGYLGDSGNSNGVSPHLHFEVHPNGGAAVNPYSHLNEARRLLFARPTYDGSFKVSLAARFRSAGDGKLAVAASSVRVPATRWTTIPGRQVSLLYGNDAVVRRRNADGDVRSTTFASAKYDERVRVWTGYVAEPRRAQLGHAGMMVAAKVELRGT